MFTLASSAEKHDGHIPPFICEQRLEKHHSPQQPSSGHISQSEKSGLSALQSITLVWRNGCCRCLLLSGYAVKVKCMLAECLSLPLHLSSPYSVILFALPLSANPRRSLGAKTLINILIIWPTTKPANNLFSQTKIVSRTWGISLMEGYNWCASLREDEWILIDTLVLAHAFSSLGILVFNGTPLPQPHI